jgi:hypothetical protein
MKMYRVIQSHRKLGDHAWRVVYGEFMEWEDISFHATKQDAVAAKVSYEIRDAKQRKDISP